jgi:pentose-5-phosphate-3-epimerase
MKISASLYSAGDTNLQELVRELDAYRSDYFHIDCNNNASVFDDIARIKTFSSTPIDLHIISSEPQKYYEQIIQLGVELVTIQFENIESWTPLPASFKGKLGIAITTNTSIDVFEQFANQASFILFMATTPGKSGEPFQPQNFRKIREFRNRYPDKKIHVDGGINAELSFILRNMGVYSVVVGSYLLKQEFIGSAMMMLRSNEVGSSYCVGDFMLNSDEIPVLKLSDYHFRQMLQVIDNYKLGFVNIVDNNNQLIGIVSNADIRRALLKNWAHLEHLKVEEVMNVSPATVRSSNTVSQLLDYIKSLTFPVLFLPVTNENGELVGTLKFNNLIKGEL